MNNWEGITEFVCVAETESFTAASKRLGISTAQVSRQISALETRLAIKLFNRTTRKVTITEIGQIYYNHCRQVLDGLAEAERVITDLNQTPRGRLNLTAPVTYGENIIAPLVNDFAVLYPELEINLVLTNQMLDLVADRYDLAIRLGELEDSTLMGKRLASRAQYVCASPDYLAKYGVPKTLADLNQHNCLQGVKDYWRFEEEGKAYHISVTGSIRCNSSLSLIDAAIKNIGIVQLPDYYVQQHLEDGLLVSILEKFRAKDEGIWAIYPHNRHLSPKVSLLLKYLVQNLK
jgi:DNA-binding transcriptional LysR family regulator